MYIVAEFAGAAAEEYAKVQLFPFGTETCANVPNTLFAESRNTSRIHTNPADTLAVKISPDRQYVAPGIQGCCVVPAYEDDVMVDEFE